MTPTIKRTYSPNITTGFWLHDDEIVCNTMELPWKENARNISCIPEGMYTVIKQLATKQRPYNYFRILGVPNRDGILIHKITYVKDLRGCIGVGKELKHLDRDGTIDMIRSGEALAELWQLLPDTFTLKIEKL